MPDREFNRQQSDDEDLDVTFIFVPVPSELPSVTALEYAIFTDRSRPLIREDLLTGGVALTDDGFRVFVPASRVRSALGVGRYSHGARYAYLDEGVTYTKQIFTGALDITEGGF